jgi:prophage regulatory protein
MVWADHIRFFNMAQTQAITPFPIIILRRPDVEKRTGLSRSSIYAYMEKGEFPKPIKLGTEGGTVGWLEHEINAWIHDAIERTRGKTERA